MNRYEFFSVILQVFEIKLLNFIVINAIIVKYRFSSILLMCINQKHDLKERKS